MYANGSEYLQARLKSPLKKDSIYCLSLYISLAEKSSHFVDQVGMYFTDKKIEKVGWQILNYKPVLNNKRGNILKNTEDWTLISGLYKAKGNEKFILIGNFSCSDSSNYHETKARILFQPFRMNAYYYIDDVSVVPYSLKNKTVCTVEDYMNSFSKSNYYKLEFNKKIILKNLFFDVDKFIIKPNGYKTLQPLLLFLKYETNTKIEIIGHTDNSGTEEHNRKLSRNRAQSVAKYLIDNGIDKKHIYYNGVGSTEPISSNSTEKGKSKNRRVEIRLFK
ncbi:MAG: OmpA family protein, partial [Bacteroidota bacterium]|nr:OmpA family protein [Bacteroidota bacterium]